MFQSLVNKADAAGNAAVAVLDVTPMAVTDGRQVWVVPGGTCGFAWIRIAGNTAFGRWAKRTGLARSAYPSGLHINVVQFGQSMERKEAYARAFAAILRSEGIEAFADSRMD